MSLLLTVFIIIIGSLPAQSKQLWPTSKVRLGLGWQEGISGHNLKPSSGLNPLQWIESSAVTSNDVTKPNLGVCVCVNVCAFVRVCLCCEYVCVCVCVCA